jgi:hypothetical protein
VFYLCNPVSTLHRRQEGLKLNGTHLLSAYANDVNLVGVKEGTVQKNTNALLDASNEVGLEVNPMKRYLLMSRCKKAGQKHNIKIVNRSF